MTDSTNEKLLIAAFPSVGLVGAFATSYLVEQLQMKDIGELEYSKISPSYMVKEGEILGPVRIYNKANVYAILAGIPLSPLSSYDFMLKAIEFAKNNDIKKIIIPRGLELDPNFEEEPRSYGLAVNTTSKSLLDEYNLQVIPDGAILGTDAGAISALKNSDVMSILLYTTCRIMMPDDDAIVQSIKTIADIIKVKIDTEKFEEQLEKIRKNNEKLIEDTKKFFKGSPETSASISPPGVA